MAIREIIEVKEKVSLSDIVSIIDTPQINVIRRETGNFVSLGEDESAVDAKIGQWFHYKLRDRENDGPYWRPTRLTQWPYHHIADQFTAGRAVEESTYWLDPRAPITSNKPQDIADFIVNPFEELPIDQPTTAGLEQWLRKWQMVYSDDHLTYPGFYSYQKIPGLRRTILDRSQKILAERGYNYLTAVPTWFHTAKMYEHLGFLYTHPSDKFQLELLTSRLPYGTSREQVEASWVVVLQFWNQLAEGIGLKPEDYLERKLILRKESGDLLTYPLSPNRNLWMQKKL